MSKRARSPHVVSSSGQPGKSDPVAMFVQIATAAPTHFILPANGGRPSGSARGCLPVESNAGPALQPAEWIFVRKRGLISKPRPCCSARTAE